MQTEPDSTRTVLSPRLDGTLANPVQLALTLMDPTHDQRGFAEAFVSAVFRRAYGATLSAFYPLLLGLTRDSGEYSAVAGIRPAGSDALFSEHYLDQPVERLLSTERAGIAEIGNLAPANAGQARWLICTLSAFLMGAGFTHVVFTSVPRLRNAFNRMGLPLTRLSDAHRERLPAEQQAEWGSYYDCKPAVYAGDIVAGTPALLALMAADTDLLRLTLRAYDTGRAFASDARATLL
jgi:hypothetical protein